MEFWTQWLNVIHSLLMFLASEIGLGTGLGIVALTLLLRTVILPISWPIAYRGYSAKENVTAAAGACAIEARIWR